MNITSDYLREKELYILDNLIMENKENYTAKLDQQFDSILKANQRGRIGYRIHMMIEPKTLIQVHVSLV